jgi:hypothetical protein
LVIHAPGNLYFAPIAKLEGKRRVVWITRMSLVLKKHSVFFRFWSSSKFIQLECLFIPDSSINFELFCMKVEQDIPIWSGVTTGENLDLTLFILESFINIGGRGGGGGGGGGDSRINLNCFRTFLVLLCVLLIQMTTALFH